ncbi:MAG: helix-turn-helix domain-containing protein [Acidithiobacillus sp.]
MVRANAMLAEMPLHELRQARGLSQQTLATILNVKQPSIAKLEHRTGMYLSTLHSILGQWEGSWRLWLASPMAA